MSINHEVMACRDEDPELFAPDHAGPEVALAKAVCNGCSQRIVCLAEALEGDEYGIWGGTTRRERNKMKNRRVDA